MSDQVEVSLENYTKRKIKREYLLCMLGLSDAVPALMFYHDLTQGEAITYLMQ